VASVAVLALSGTIAAIREIGELDALVATSYGRVLLLKVALVLVALAFAVHNRRGPARFVAQARTEALILVGVLGATAALTGIAPGSSASAGGAGRPFSAYTSLGAWELAFEIAPARAATSNDVHVVLTNAVGAPALDARDAALTAELTDAGVGRIDVPLRLLTTGHWIGDVVFPQPGRWTVRLTVRRGEFAIERLVESVDVQGAR
jgi:copper transport protein